MDPLDKQLNTMISTATMTALKEIETRHKLPVAQFTRSLVEGAVAFYREHGFFSFPVRIEPEAFQREWLKTGEGAQAGYGVRGMEPSPTAIIEAEEASRRYDAEQKKAARKKRAAASRKPATGGV